MSERQQHRPFRLLVLLEGTTVTGPGRNVLEFCCASRTLPEAAPVAVSLACFVRGSGKEPLDTSGNNLLAAAQAAGLSVAPIQEHFPFDPSILPTLRTTLRRLQPDIIETHHVKSHFLVRLSGMWRRLPWIAFHHGYTMDARRTIVFNQLDRWSLPAAARVVTVCQPFRKELEAHGVPGSHISVVHNAILPEWVDGPVKEQCSQPHSLDPHDGGKTVLAVGRLSQEKAFTDLVMAIHELRRLSSDMSVRLLLAGEGPERARIQRLAQRLDLEDRVRLLGHMSDLRPYYQMADVVAISSLSEGSPNVLLEAMAAGVPVAATAVGGIPEIVRHQETALLVEPKQPAQMAEAIRLLLSDTCLAQSLAARAQETIRTCYSPQVRARQLIALYTALLG